MHHLYKTITKYQIGIFMGLFGCIFMCLFAYGIGQICSFSIFPDEFGYWAAAANLAGYDWSETASLGYYYSYGYGILLYPILKFVRLLSDMCGGLVIGNIQAGILAYRLALAANFFLQYAALYLIYKLLEVLFPEKDNMECLMMSAIGTFYPAWLFYSQMTLVESLLSFLFVTITYLFFRFLNKPSQYKLIGLICLCAYTYTVHMRTIGVWIAVLTCVFYFIISNNNVSSKNKIIFSLINIGLSIALFLFVTYLMKLYRLDVYNAISNENSGVNTYGNQWSKIGFIFSCKGIKMFIESFIGKYLYVMAGTMGMAVFAIKWFMAKIKEDRKSVNGYVSIYIFLATFLTFLISVIYTVYAGYIDSYIYGRYVEFFIPILLCIGGMYVLDDKMLKRTALIQVSLCILISLILYIAIIRRGIENLRDIRGYMIVSLSIFLDDTNFDLARFFAVNCAWIAAVSILFIAYRSLLRKLDNERSAGFLFVIVILEIVLSIVLSQKYTYNFNKPHFSDKVIIETLEEKELLSKVVFLNEDGKKYIDVVQMQMQQYPLEIIGPEDVYSNDTLTGAVIAYKWTKYRDVLSKLYENCVETSTYYLYY